MLITERHEFDIAKDLPRPLCKCGKPFEDTIHLPKITKVQGTATPTKTGRVNQ